jgi:hypothetical protein
MPGSVSAGGQLYGHFAQLLAPAGSTEGTSSLVLLETAGKDVAAVAAMTGPEADEALADFANAVPGAAATFLATGNDYDDEWKFVIESAVASGPVDDPASVTVGRLLEDNRSDFSLMGRARFTIPADLYHPVRAEPADWLGSEGWSSVSFRIGEENPEPAPPPPDVVTPRDVPDLTWRRTHLFASAPSHGAGPPPLIRPARLDIAVRDPRVLKVVREVRASQPVTLDRGMRWKDVMAASRATETASEVTVAHPSASGFELSFDYRIVGLRRPWLQAQLCHLTGWVIPGLAPGGISNGQPTGNPGLIPVLTTRMLVVRNLEVRAHWSEADRDKATSTGTIAFGPFAVTGEAGFDGSQMSRPAPQVVAWLGTVVPASPAG